MELKVGSIYSTNRGGDLTVVGIKSNREVLVKFRDDFGFECVASKWDILKGEVKNPYYPTLSGVGYLGEGRHKPSYNGERSRAYMVYKEVLRRCYNDEHLAKRPSYEGCFVREDWFDFQNFAEWFEALPQKNLKDGNKYWCADKDIILMGNREYSADTCVLVPNVINCFFREHNSGEVQKGYYLNKTSGKFMARTSVVGRGHTFIGNYASEEEAREAYVVKKCEQGVLLADKYGRLLDTRVVDCLLNYKSRLDIITNIIEVGNV